jgi:hypothetical protein
MQQVSPVCCARWKTVLVRYIFSLGLIIVASLSYYHAGDNIETKLRSAEKEYSSRSRKSIEKRVSEAYEGSDFEKDLLTIIVDHIKVRCVSTCLCKADLGCIGKGCLMYKRSNIHDYLPLGPLCSHPFVPVSLIFLPMHVTGCYVYVVPGTLVEGRKMSFTDPCKWQPSCRLLGKV